MIYVHHPQLLDEFIKLTFYFLSDHYLEMKLGLFLCFFPQPANIDRYGFHKIMSEYERIYLKKNLYFTRPVFLSFIRYVLLFLQFLGGLLNSFCHSFKYRIMQHLTISE